MHTVKITHQEKWDHPFHFIILFVLVTGLMSTLNSLSLSSRALVKRLAVVFEPSQMRLKGLFKLSAVRLHVLLFLNLAVMDLFHMFSLSMATKLGVASRQTCLKPDTSLTVPSLKDKLRWNVHRHNVSLGCQLIFQWNWESDNDWILRAQINAVP